MLPHISECLEIHVMRYDDVQVFLYSVLESVEETGV